MRRPARWRCTNAMSNTAIHGSTVGPRVALGERTPYPLGRARQQAFEAEARRAVAVAHDLTEWMGGLIHSLLQFIEAIRRPFVAASNHADESQGSPFIDGEHVRLVGGLVEPLGPHLV